jgi:hypothetical protein
MLDRVALDSMPLDRMSLAVREVGGFLDLACALDDEGAVHAAIRQRVGDLLANMSPDDQAWVLALLHEMPAALRGGYNATPAIATVMQRLAGTEAAAALNAGPRRYVMSRHGGRTMTWVPSVLVGFALTDATAHWKPGHPTGAQAALLGAVGSADLIQQRAGGLLAAAQYAWRAGTYDADWELAVDRIAAHARRSVFSWGPNDLALIAALTAVDRIAGSPWLGPLKPQLTAAQFESSDWAMLLAAMAASDGASKPGKGIAAKWAGSLAAIGTDVFRERVMGWLAQHPLDPQSPDPDADALKQLIWLVGTTGESAAAPLGRFAQRCFVKVPNIGARSVKLGNAALAALGLVEPPTAGAAELDRLRQRVKYPSALKQIEAALALAAKRAGMTAEDLAELAVPEFDLGADGRVHAMTDAGGVTLALTEGRRVMLTWHGAVAHDAGGKELAAPPVALKQADPALVKDFTERRRALEAMLAGQIARIEGFYHQDRSWDGTAWTARYVRHGLLGPLSRRLIWQVARDDGSTASVLPTQAGLVDAAGDAVHLGATDRVRLWHPIDAGVDQVLAWRAAIVARGIVQPFKQAHREIYRLTDAERATGTYSNRFAGHILRQHQMLELAKARGWTGTLQGGFDNANDPAKDFKAHGMRVEYAVAPILGRDDDMSHTGIALRVATDRVMFRELAAGGRLVALTSVPPVVLSEALRDVDLFVGVASLGADPAWTDGGPAGRFGDYWRSFAQAELEESGKMRHATLAALLPRLNIAAQCVLEARHLVVRGRRNTYRIHIGSGSVFFEPAGQYLCIVPDRRGRDGEVPLPFEGDAMLSLIISKATMLVRDDLIKDTSILSQLGRWP